MNILVKDIFMPLEHETNEIYEKALKKSGVSRSNVESICVHKKSIDARKNDIKFVYSVAMKLSSSEKIKVNEDVTIKDEYEYKYEKPEALPSSRPIIVGFGPAGLFCAYLLAINGFKPIVLEQGKNVDERKKDVDFFFKTGIFNKNSNVQFGEGGAGTFSDGKLTTRINDNRLRFVLETFHKFGADNSILYEAHPHVGTDLLVGVIKNMREEIIKLGGEIHFTTKVTDILISDGKVKGVTINGNEKIYSDYVVLAIGHSSRDTYKMLREKGIFMEKKDFSVGFRIEHKREFIDYGRYGKYAGHKNLKSAEYQLSCRDGKRGCYTFCMCPGGKVIASNSEEEMVVTNGMSESGRNMINSNSAVVASVLKEDFETDLFSGLDFQRELEKKAYELGMRTYRAPAQLVKDYLSNEKSKSFLSVLPSYPIGTEFCNFNNVFPKKVNDMLLLGLRDFDRKIKGFSTTDGVLTGIETRTSAPLRITRDENLNSISLKGLYPAGEGAGYAGGITSAAVDGLKIAEEIMKMRLL